MPQTEFVGRGTVAELKGILSAHNPKNIFLVTGKGSYEKSGAKGAIEPYLVSYRVVNFSDFEVNPKLRDIERGIRLFKENGCDFVIGVGGGSVIDVAKSVRIFAANEGKPEEYVKNTIKIQARGKPFVAIPTTSGSGSEATKFAVIYVDKTKYSLEHEFMQADYAIVDPQFTLNLPKHQTACSGMDALAQAIESYWCVNSTDESKGYAKEAIALVIGNLADAVNHPSEKSREAMSRAAHLAGKAINISKTTASHAVSYPITTYFGVPHGHAAVLTLPQMLIYNSQVTEEDVLDKRGADYVRSTINELVNLLGSKSAEEASQKIMNLMEGVGLKTRLGELGVNAKEDFDLIVQNGFNPQRVKNNPRLLTEPALRKILDDIR